VNRGKQTALGAPGVCARPRRTLYSSRLRFIYGLLIHIHIEGSGLHTCTL